MTECCRRCRREIHHLPGRFRFKLEDYADASAATYSGRLCRRCWDDLLDYLGVFEERGRGGRCPHA